MAATSAHLDPHTRPPLKSCPRGSRRYSSFGIQFSASHLRPSLSGPWRGWQRGILPAPSGQPLQSRNRRVAHVVRTSNLTQRLPRLPSGPRLGDLMCRELRLPAEPHAPCHRPCPPFAGSGQDQAPLKLMSNAIRNCPLCVMKNCPHPGFHGLG